MVMLSTASSALGTATQSWKTAIEFAAGSNRQTRLSPLVVKYTASAPAQMPSPPLNAVVVAWRSGPLGDVGTHVTVDPDTDAAKRDPALRSPGVAGTNLYSRPAGSSSVR